jgi:uncharacterized protein (TIGR00369 family)
MERIQESFGRQAFMRTLGAELVSSEPGKVVIACGRTDELTQQHGYIHAGVLAAIADSACGYAALSVMPERFEVVSVEFKINMLRPCTAERVLATGSVIKAGRTLVVCDADVTDASGETLFAKMTATMFAVAKAD